MWHDVETGQGASGLDVDSPQLVVQGQPSAYNDQAAAGGCNYEYILDPLPWEGAQQACRARGGHLASVHSEYDMAIIHQKILAIHQNEGSGAGDADLRTSAWIGLNDREVRS
jgi:hypothetical protein